MIFPYSIRLICLSLEMLFLANLATSAFVLAFTPTVAKFADKTRPHHAAQWFFSLRLLPFTLSLLLVATLCVPSYLRYEQNTGSEGMGVFCIITALLGLGLVLTSLVRFTSAVSVLYQLSRELRSAETACVAEAELCVTDEAVSGAPLMALVGILRPRLVVSQRLLQSLSMPQLKAALRHERAHLLSGDNQKRLLMAITPSLLPCMRNFSALEAHWERFAELAADDYAAAGEVDQSIALAEALVKVARLSNFERRMPLVSSLSATNRELAFRVDRLLAVDGGTARQAVGGRPSSRKALTLVGALCLLALLPKILFPLYKLLESLLH